MSSRLFMATLCAAALTASLTGCTIGKGGGSLDGKMKFVVVEASGGG